MTGHLQVRLVISYFLASKKCFNGKFSQIKDINEKEFTILISCHYSFQVNFWHDQKNEFKLHLTLKKLS